MEHDIRLDKDSSDVKSVCMNALHDEHHDSKSKGESKEETGRNYCSTVLLIKYNTDKNRKVYRNRTPRDTAKPHSETTSRMNRFTSVKTSDNIAKKNYMNRAIMRAETANFRILDLDPSDNPSDTSYSSRYLSSGISNNSTTLSEPTETHTSNSTSTKRLKHPEARKDNIKLLKPEIPTQYRTHIDSTKDSGEISL